ncbi:MAG: hypothetical protein JWL90_3536, partial [Chthoniobacteraceae bacterium]|nr:hypothetical protein [Chthoniobacteraceae bacterium]
MIERLCKEVESASRTVRHGKLPMLCEPISRPGRGGWGLEVLIDGTTRESRHSLFPVEDWLSSAAGFLAYHLQAQIADRPEIARVNPAQRPRSACSLPAEALAVRRKELIHKSPAPKHLTITKITHPASDGFRERDPSAALKYCLNLLLAESFARR